MPQAADLPQDDADPQFLQSAQLAQLSALADGESAALDAACTAWRTDASAREAWYTYHLIGDVLRSEELASTPARDAAFLARLHERLASEPTVLAPAPAVAAAARKRHGWIAPAAVAAGFMAVAAVLVVSRVAQPPADSAPVLSAAPLGVQALRAGNNPASGSVSASAPMVVLVDGQMLRDARLDAYLRAHRDTLGGPTAAVPGGAVRSVGTLLPQQR